MKDRSYHESAILYNEGIAAFAEAQTEKIEHPIPKKWNAGVAKQHRFHEKRHRAALEKLDAREAELDAQEHEDWQKLEDAAQAELDAPIDSKESE